MIRITSKKDGFRRGGVAHPVTPTEYPDDFFTKKQLQQIKEESMLVVQFVKDKEEKKKDEGAGAGAGDGGKG